MYCYGVCIRYLALDVGGDLEEFIQAQEGKNLSEQVVLSMFSQLCLGLQEVHAKYQWSDLDESSTEISKLQIFF